MVIKNIMGYELLDSRGNPTVATKITLDDSSIGFAISPSGASTGKYEAHELRDKDANRYNGKGTIRAVDNINTAIRNAIVNKNFDSQEEFDNFLISLDGTANKEYLGANAILATSLAFAKATASQNKIPLYKYLSGNNKISLPRPMMNILNGGAHSSNNIDIQEFMIIPTFKSSFSEHLRVCTEIYHKLKEVLVSRNLSTGVGDEGGFAPTLKNDEEAIELIIESIIKSGYSTNDVKIGLDIASSEWFNDNIYRKPKAKTEYSAEGLIEYYGNLIKNYPIISIEDPFDQDDFQSFTRFNSLFGQNLQIVGDDLFVTNKQRLEKGIEEKSGNAILIKPNQIGTLTETINVIKLAKESGFNTIISHRSGETEDNTIADIGVGLNVGQIKTGAPCRSDRISKYNRLLIIEKEICC